MSPEAWRFLGDSAGGPVLAPVHVGYSEDVEALDRRCRAVTSGFTGGAIELLCEPDELLLRGLGRALELDGRFFAAHGPGAGSDELRVIREETTRVIGLESGDPSPFTALGAFAAIRACVDDIVGARVAVLGAGRVGAHLVKLLDAEGAEVFVADLEIEKAVGTGETVLTPEELLGLPCDVLSPNARGPVVTPETAPRMRCRFIAGAANGQLASPGVARLLEERDIGFVPEEIAGSGWILNLAAEFHPDGYDVHRAAELVRSIAGIARESLER